MATTKETGEFFLEQAGEGVTIRRMFGEFAVYMRERTVGFLCDDRFYAKPYAPVRAFLGAGAPMGRPYPGAKAYFRVEPDAWEDAERLRALLGVLDTAVPAKKPARKRKAVRGTGPAIHGLPPDFPDELK